MQPRASRVLVRAALVHLALGSALGLAMLAGRTALLPPLPRAAALEAHAELLLFGWVLQLAAGVALWILPRAPGAGTRRPEAPGWAVLALLNAGVLAVALDRLLGAGGALRLAGRGAELAAVAAFAAHAVPRLQGGFAARSRGPRGGA